MSETEQKTEVKKSYTREEVEAGLAILHQEYFMQVISLLTFQSGGEENLNYCKVPIITPDGGTYLLSILHVDGPKLNLHKLRAIAEAKQEESQNKNPQDGS